MINPSAIGWIDKFFLKQKKSLLPNEAHSNSFYNKVRETGFIYGHIVSFELMGAFERRHAALRRLVGGRG